MLSGPLRVQLTSWTPIIAVVALAAARWDYQGAIGPVNERANPYQMIAPSASAIKKTGINWSRGKTWPRISSSISVPTSEMMTVANSNLRTIPRVSTSFGFIVCYGTFEQG